MIDQYVDHITEERYGWITQLIEHKPGKQRSERQFFVEFDPISMERYRL